MEYHRRLPDNKYTETEAEFLFQTIEMAKSDEEEYELDDLLPHQEPPMLFSRKEEKRRQRWHHRRHTHSLSHSPPAPPSTPTSLTANTTTTATATTPPSTAAAARGAADRLLYVLDFAAKYKKKLKEQQRTDSELAELFDVITITGSGRGADAKGRGSSKLPPERGICASSRTIHKKHDMNGKVFKIHRNPKEFEFFREADEEDSVSAPEYDAESLNRRLRLLKPRLKRLKQRRRIARFEHRERMDAIIDTFDGAMRINNDA